RGAHSCAPVLALHQDVVPEHKRLLPRVTQDQIILPIDSSDSAARIEGSKRSHHVGDQQLIKPSRGVSAPRCHGLACWMAVCRSSPMAGSKCSEMRRNSLPGGSFMLLTRERSSGSDLANCWKASVPGTSASTNCWASSKTLGSRPRTFRQTWAA